MAAVNADRNLLFGLLALQIGLVDQEQLVAAFRAWTRDKGRQLAEYLVERGVLDEEERSAVEAMVGLHEKRHGGSTFESLAAVPAARSTRESLAAVGNGDGDILDTLEHVGTLAAATQTAAGGERTSTHCVGSATSYGERFRVLRPHARGGLGAVFVAVDNELHREVALKQILEKHADDPVSRQRFVAEAEITGGLEHPGVVPVYGLGTDALGRPYYAMRFIKGESLKEAIARFHDDRATMADPGRRSLGLRKLLRRFTDVCNAIDYAHSRGVIHRDLKPANIIIGKHGETLVVDWGLAKAVGHGDHSSGEQTLAPSSSGSSETLPGSAMGTPSYMSPEQARGELSLLGPRSDVYSLGATLYCLLTGKPPYDGDDVGAILRAVQEGQFSRRIGPDKALEAVCAKAMATVPEERYATPKALADDLDRWMADEPVSAWREPYARRARRWARRNRTAVTTLAASVLVALVGTGAVLAVQTRANTELRSANLDLLIARDRIAQANADLKSANDREKQRFSLAMDAIKLFHGEVSEDLLLKEKQFEGLRTKLLKGAAAFYARLEGLLKGQTDRESRAALGKAYYALGDLTARIGDQSAALAVHKKALAVRQQLGSEAGSDAATKLDVARSLMGTGWLQLSTGDVAGARDSSEEARRLAEDALAQDRMAKEARAMLGDAYHQIGYVRRETGDAAGAREAYGKALAIREKLADEYPTSAQFLSETAGTMHNIAAILSSQGHTPEALALYERARSMSEKAVQIDGSVAGYQVFLANHHSAFGDLMSQMGDHSGALAAFGKAYVIREKLAEAHPNVTRFQQDLANSQDVIGWRQSRTGDKAVARAAFGKALAIRQSLANANPSVTTFQRDLARSHDHIGGLFSQAGDMPAALGAFGKAVAIRQKLADANPGVTDFQRDLAQSYDNFGTMRSLAGDAAGSLASHRQALAIQRKLADASPDIIGFQQAVAYSYNSIGRELLQLRDTAGARGAYSEALAIRQRLADHNPKVTQLQLDLADTLHIVGGLMRKEGQPDRDLAGARAAFDRALAIEQKLADAEPSDTRFRRALADSHDSIGFLLFETGDRAGAVAARGRALAIREKLADAEPSNIDLQRPAANSLADMGRIWRSEQRPADAAACFRKAIIVLERLRDAGAEDLYDMACDQAMLGGVATDADSGVSAAAGRASADRAMALLGRAIVGGTRRRSQIPTDTDLEPLRGRADFRLLMLDLAMPADPFARAR